MLQRPPSSRVERFPYGRKPIALGLDGQSGSSHTQSDGVGEGQLKRVLEIDHGSIGGSSVLQVELSLVVEDDGVDGGNGAVVEDHRAGGGATCD